MKKIYFVILYLPFNVFFSAIWVACVTYMIMVIVQRDPAEYPLSAGVIVLCFFLLPFFLGWETCAKVNAIKHMFSPFTCEWTQDGNPIEYNVWESGCGHSLALEEDTPKENDMNYCPFCGKPLKQKMLSELFQTEEE